MSHFFNTLNDFPLYAVRSRNNDDNVDRGVGGYKNLEEAVRVAEETESFGTAHDIRIVYYSSFTGESEKDTILSLEEARRHLKAVDMRFGYNK